MQPRPLEPIPELRTERLRLRAPDLEDAEALAAIYGDPEVGRYLGFRLIHRTEQMREKLARDLEAVRRGEGMRWVLCAHADAAPAGYVGIFSWSQRDRRAEVGYVVARELWGQGVMKELFPALLHFGFGRMGLHRLEARVDSRNGASLRVLLRAGFQVEGVLREHHVAEPEGFGDTTLLALLEGEWRRGYSHT
ncbi:GNAT family N-acetyltransferase [Corallococcus sp. H22C18031201]|uniref:GNAT family N-acetyltransferase n=1 Tax=Citreicoccus inhibens TaxID=2849499 RepID=UPI000E726E17|nr:GNAT family N-acetyltransferase [Citreicoccus inhibens]MBU8900403.1 GNAT family N-acetyltransferase [Citreicoccus inhibens]RJS25046.1 GNAT family N-acetyltransferase [Corallococcus sp. H22C18031201]